MAITNEIKTITCKYPSYLEALLQENDSIKLVYRTKQSVSGEEEISINMSDTLDTTELDLTGQPLMVDLCGDDTLCNEIIVQKPHNWTAEESKYYSITLSEARAFINNQLKLAESLNNKPMFCLCDGGDEKHTVMLGSSQKENKLTNILVHVMPCCNEGGKETTLEYMKNEHIKNVRKNEKVQIVNTKCYYLLGYNLKNCLALQSVETNGSISVEVSDDKNERLSQTNEKIKMNLQVIIGHNSSVVKKFWEELEVIQSYINILSRGNVYDATVITSENGLGCSEISIRISELLANVFYVKEINRNSLDLQNLRQESILDKLWNVLRRCRTLDDLRDSFHFFFEELAETERKIQVLDHNQSTVAEIVNGILNGKVAAPTLGFSQALELLVELGVEKLKNDYIVILTHFYSLAKDSALSKWRDLSASVLDSNPSMKRKTRISINPKSNIINLSSLKLKMTYLSFMHIVAEFIFLFKQNLSVSEATFDQFCESVCKKFLNTAPSIAHVAVFNKPYLSEFLFHPFLPDMNEFINDKSPVNWSLKLKSSFASCEVMTVFYFSEIPIFSSSIYENYDIKMDDINVKSLYVTKLVKYEQQC